MGFYLSLTMKYIKKNKKRTIVTIIGIILSAALLSGIGTIAVSMQETMTRDVINDNGDYYGIFKNLKGDKVNVLKDHVKVEKELIWNTSYIGEVPNEKGKSIVINKVDKFNETLQPYNVKEGQFPKKEDEIAITNKALKVLGNKKIGDSITLDVLNENKKLENKTFKIVGLLDSVVIESKSNNVFMALSNLNNINNSTNYDVYVKLKSNRNIRAEFESIAKDLNIEKIDGKLPIEYNDRLLDCYGQSDSENLNGVLLGMSIIIGSLVLIATIATVYNSFSISIVERKKLFSTLASVGATKLQIKKMVFAEGILMSLIGIPIGIFFGTATLNLLFKLMNYFLKDSMIGSLNLQTVISGKIILISFIVIFITVLISALAPAQKASKVSIIDGIRGNTDYKLRKVKSGKLIKLVLGVEGQFAYKNLKRNKRKYRVTIASLVFSIILFLTFNGMLSVCTTAFDSMYSLSNYDFFIPIYDNLKDDVKDKICKADGIERVSNLKLLSCNSIIKLSNFTDEAKELIKNEENVNLGANYMTVGDKEFDIINKKLIDGNFNEEEALKDNGAILVFTNKIIDNGKISDIEMFNLKVGDYITLTKKDKNISVKVKIVALTNEVPTGVDNALKGPILITSDKVFDSVLNEVKKQDSTVEVNNSISIKSSNPKETKTQLEKISQEYSSFNIIDLTSEKEYMHRSKVGIMIFLNGFIAVVTLIGVSNIINTIQTNIALRKREFAMIQSIGITPQGLNKILYLESIYYGVMSLIIAIPIGLLLCYGIQKSMSMLVNIKFVFPYTSIIISIIGIFFIVLIAGYFPISKLKKENIIENIRLENV